jgi:4Fe-4S ferredoxin
MTLAFSDPITTTARMTRRERAERLSEMLANPKCDAPAGSIRPVVDLRACEGKGDCAKFCPEHVFEIARIDDASFAALPLINRFKLWAHGKKIAYTPNADACLACGLLRGRLSRRRDQAPKGALGP